MGFLQYTLVATTLIFAQTALCHSTISEPQPISPGYCWLGDGSDEDCYGPCDLRGATGGYSNFDSPDKPAAVYKRGQRVAIKYHRNNHGPGGFIRISLVKPEDMMDKAIHERNAFHYSCWGAIPMEAERDELATDEFGFSKVGNDGEFHSEKKAYYVAFVKVPTVVPDGDYVLGWVWYGGTTSLPIQDNKPMKPLPFGRFGDFWACSYVKIKGGKLSSSYDPVFVNDMKKFSSTGCMAANDEPGVCDRGPCMVPAFFRKPRPFNGSKPLPITSDNF